MSVLIDSRKCSRIFSGVPEITVYLQKAGEHAVTFCTEPRTDAKRNPPTKHVLDASEGGGTGTLF